MPKDSKNLFFKKSLTEHLSGFSDQSENSRTSTPTPTGDDSKPSTESRSSYPPLNEQNDDYDPHEQSGENSSSSLPGTPSSSTSSERDSRSVMSGSGHKANKRSLKTKDHGPRSNHGPRGGKVDRKIEGRKSNYYHRGPRQMVPFPHARPPQPPPMFMTEHLSQSPHDAGFMNMMPISSPKRTSRHSESSSCGSPLPSGIVYGTHTPPQSPRHGQTNFYKSPMHSPLMQHHPSPYNSPPRHVPSPPVRFIHPQQPLTGSPQQRAVFPIPGRSTPHDFSGTPPHMGSPHMGSPHMHQSMMMEYNMRMPLNTDQQAMLYQQQMVQHQQQQLQQQHMIHNMEMINQQQASNQQMQQQMALQNQMKQLSLQGHSQQMGQMQQMGQLPQMGQMSQIGQMSQMGQIPQMGQMPQMGQIQQMDQMQKMGQMQHMGQIQHMRSMPNTRQIPQIGQLQNMGEMQQMGQMHQFRQTQQMIPNPQGFAALPTQSIIQQQMQCQGMMLNQQNISQNTDLQQYLMMPQQNIQHERIMNPNLNQMPFVGQQMQMQERLIMQNQVPVMSQNSNIVIPQPVNPYDRNIPDKARETDISEQKEKSTTPQPPTSEQAENEVFAPSPTQKELPESTPNAQIYEQIPVTECDKITAIVEEEPVTPVKSSKSKTPGIIHLPHQLPTEEELLKSPDDALAGTPMHMKKNYWQRRQRSSETSSEPPPPMQTEKDIVKGDAEISKPKVDINSEDSKADSASPSDTRKKHLHKTKGFNLSDLGDLVNSTVKHNSTLPKTDIIPTSGSIEVTLNQGLRSQSPNMAYSSSTKSEVRIKTHHDDRASSEKWRPQSREQKSRRFDSDNWRKTGGRDESSPRVEQALREAEAKDLSTGKQIQYALEKLKARSPAPRSTSESSSVQCKKEDDVEESWYDSDDEDQIDCFALTI